MLTKMLRPAPPTLRVRRREVAATLPPASADLGRGWRRRGGGAARSPLESPGVTQEVRPKVLVRALLRRMVQRRSPWPATLPGREDTLPAAMLRPRNMLRAGLARIRGDAVWPWRKSWPRGSPVNVAVNTDSSCCAAMGDGRLFEALDAEWAVVGASPAARAAFERWAMVEPALAGMASPAEAVRSCRAATPAAAAAVLGALLRHAGEPLAARAVLQAVVPALRTLAARRAGGSRQLTRQAWEAADDFDADVVEVALRRIAALAGTSPTWPAQAICESTWMTLRAALVRSSRWGTLASLDDDVADVVASPARSGAEALALAVVDAVRAQRLAVDDARVIYATRVLGHTPAELASAQGRKVRALRAQRVRAERRLVDAGWAPRTRVSCRRAGAGADRPPLAEPLQPEVEPGIDRGAHPRAEVVDHGHAVADQSVGERDRGPGCRRCARRQPGHCAPRRWRGGRSRGRDARDRRRRGRRDGRPPGRRHRRTATAVDGEVHPR